MTFILEYSRSLCFGLLLKYTTSYSGWCVRARLYVNVNANMYVGLHPCTILYAQVGDLRELGRQELLAILDNIPGTKVP